MKLNILPASSGISWLKRGFASFRKQLLGITGMFSLLLTASMLLGMVPIVGVIFSLMALPAISLCMMLITRAVDQGGMALPSVIAPIFKTDKAVLKKLLLLGALYAVGVVFIIFIASVISPEAYRLIAEGDLPTMGESASGSMLFSFVFIGLCMYLLSLVFWHAPALIYWHELPAVKSLFFSTIACLKNWRAYFVFAGLFLFIQIIGSNLIILLTQLAPGMFFVFIYLSSMLMGAIMASAAYFAFIDCFGPPYSTPPIALENTNEPTAP